MGVLLIVDIPCADDVHASGWMLVLCAGGAGCDCAARTACPAGAQRAQRAQGAQRAQRTLQGTSL